MGSRGRPSSRPIRVGCVLVVAWLGVGLWYASGRPSPSVEPLRVLVGEPTGQERAWPLYREAYERLNRADARWSLSDWSAFAPLPTNAARRPDPAWFEAHRDLVTRMGEATRLPTLGLRPDELAAPFRGLETASGPFERAEWAVSSAFSRIHRSPRSSPPTVRSRSNGATAPRRLSG